MANLITGHIDIWTAAQIQKANGGRGRGRGSNGQSPHGIKKLRELILELAMRGKLVPQDSNDEPASVLLEKIDGEKARLVKDGKIKRQEALPEISEDEKPFELPVGWEWTRLGSISQINPRNEAENNLTVSFIPMPLISTSHKGEHDQEIKIWGEIKKGYTHFADGDIGVAKITPCFENSKAVVLSRLENGIGAGTTELHIARPFGSTLAPRYVLLFLKSPMFLHVGETKMTGTAGQQRLPKEFFSETPLPLPPLAEQHRIVAKVDELMTLCDKLEQQQTNSKATHQTLVKILLATLTNAADQREFVKAWQRIANHFDTLFTTEQSIDQLKQTILQLAVMGKLVPQDPDDEPASVLLEKIAKEKARLVKEGKINNQQPLPKIGQDEKPFELPQGWEWARLGDLSADIHYGYTASADQQNKDVRMLRITDIQDGVVNWESVPGCDIDRDKIANYQLEDGDILIARTGGTIGKSYLVSDINLCSVFASYLIRVRRINEMYSKFIKIYLGSQLYWNQLYTNSMGTGQPNVNGNALMNLILALPPLLEQHRIVAKVDELMSLCDTLKARLHDAKTTQVQLADDIVEQAVA
jgi:type I restriction enzyme, S subunit